MNKNVFTFSVVIVGLSIFSLSANMNRVALERFVTKADKARIVQNVVVPAAFIAYECSSDSLSDALVVATVGINEGLKNPGMAVHAALETDALAAEVSDVLSTAILADEPHMPFYHAHAEQDECIGYGDRQAMALSFGAIRVASEIGGVLLRHRINKIVKERYKGTSSMVRRRIIRTMAFAATKALAHVLAMGVGTFVLDKWGRAKRGETSASRPSEVFWFDSETFFLDTILPTLNYALAEAEGHILAQQLLEAEKER